MSGDHSAVTFCLVRMVEKTRVLRVLGLIFSCTAPLQIQPPVTVYRHCFYTNMEEDMRKAAASGACPYVYCCKLMMSERGLFQ